MENGLALWRGKIILTFLWWTALCFGAGGLSAQSVFRVATYNVENYLMEPTITRPEAKPAVARAKVREEIRAMQPDVIALEEIGSSKALEELQGSLKGEGLDLPYGELITGGDTNIHVAFLSRLPIVRRAPHTAEEFLLDGRRLQVCRGFAEIEVAVKPDFKVTLIAAHLKSRRTELAVDEAEERLAEAKILRRIVEEHLRADPEVRLIVLGDMNDTPNAESTRTIVGRGKLKLIDTRPAERNGDRPADATTHYRPRNVTWTHYYGAEDSYSRIDYILISPALLHFWLPTETYIPTVPNWGDGSDHRPIVAGFEVSRPARD
jgi:endonuclease/exonuclease/phosphatase family metal-dependent hydrolase